jgi:LysM repeat protein
VRRNALRRVLTSAALTVGLVGLGAGAAAADTYEVRSGDTLASIARDHDQVSTWRDLYEANEDEVSDPNLILPGQQLRLKAAADGTYTVEAGDTLASIASSLDGVSSWQQLADANGLADPHLIFAGQVLQLSGEATSSTSASSSTSSSSGSGSSSDSGSSSEGSSDSDAATQTSGSVSLSTWEALAECESNGNWSINTGNGYYGGLQFALSSWQAVGGSGYPHEASKEEQIRRAEKLLELQGWGAWPACSSALGLR